MSEIVFSLKKVSYSYLGKYPALAGFDLDIMRGSKVAVIGANGTGKSTLLHLLDGLIFPDSGRMIAFGQELSEEFLTDEKQSQLFRSRVGLVFQNADIQLFCPTVREDIAFGPLQLGILPDLVKKRLERVVDIFKISHLLERVPHQLSVGEKRKVALASVLINEPDVLLLDEPTAGLDPQTVRDIVDVILHLQGKGKTIITATHDLHLVGEIADVVHVFGQEKRIIRSDDPERILADQEFLRAHNLVHIHGHYHNGKAHVHSHPHGHIH
jgi:cobalt/nickel transport system ATP-binding protein